MRVPTIHLNGTAKKDLVEALCNAVHAIHEAGKALAQTCPNGRDYYPQGPDAIYRAIEEHIERMSKLSIVAKELEAIAMEVV